MQDLQRHITSRQELEQLIERYFDGLTTVEEETALRACLARCPWHSESIEDAQVVMGYFAALDKDQRHSAARTTRQRIAGIAASIVIVLSVAVFALWHQWQPMDECVAYVNGQAISNDREVMALVENDLSSIGNASQGMTAQLSSVGEALELDNE
jgi:ferric-dicitrate binding protein FerR (iron transport regulator)